MWTETPVTEIIIRTVVVYLFILSGLRMIGKRHIGELSPYSLVLLLLISESVQGALAGNDPTLAGGLLSVTVLLLINALLAYLGQKSERLDRIIEGKACVLINRGQVIQENLKREHIAWDDLQEVLREHGVISPQDVRLAMLEVDGSISVIKYSDLKEAQSN